MKFKVKDINLSTGGPLVVVLNRQDAQDMDIYALDRVKIKRMKSDDCIVAVIDISHKGIARGEIGLFEEVLKELDVEQGVSVSVDFAPKPKSITYIRNKLDGMILTDMQINEIIKDVIQNRFSEIELTYFVSGCYTNGLSMKESAALTKAIVSSGSQLKFKPKIVFDKHCAGGVPNNRTTMVVVPILAAMGYTIPKTSSRAITSAAGTADTMEVLAPVSLEEHRIVDIVNKVGACMVWGGAVGLAAADDLLIRVRHPLRLDPEGMLLASIMAKKKAVGATHVLIDLPYGYEAKFATKSKAKKLGKKFSELGKMLGMKVKVVYSDGSQPVGNGIGPSLEAADVLYVLQGDGPNDLREKSVHLATEMLKMINVKNPEQKVLDILNSGKAYEKFLEIIVAQGGNKNIRLPNAKYSHDVLSSKGGRVKNVSNKGLSKLCRLLGAPQDKAAGVYLRVKKGSRVRKGDVMFTLHSDSRAKLDSTIIMLGEKEIILF
ncbi:MAG: AMP phosphorylase [Candidatus Woesearchaeota archaeon]